MEASIKSEARRKIPDNASSGGTNLPINSNIPLTVVINLSGYREHCTDNRELLCERLKRDKQSHSRESQKNSENSQGMGICINLTASLIL